MSCSRTQRSDAGEAPNLHSSQLCYIYRGSYMSVNVLLYLLTELKKRQNVRLFLAFHRFFATRLIKSIIPALIYLVTLTFKSCFYLQSSRFSMPYIYATRPLVKSVYQKINFLISQPKHMLWVLKRTVSMRRFY